MSVPTVAPGPHRPVQRAPARSGGSVRRTTSVDARRPDGPDGPLVLEARGRDLVTSHGPAITPLDQAIPTGATAIPGGALSLDQAVSAEVDQARRLVRSLRATPAAPVAPLEGLPLGGAFRQALSRHPEVAEGSLLYALLDELPALGLVSGYELQRQVGPEGPTDHVDLAGMVDVCAGWADGSSMVRSSRARGKGPWILGPAAPVLPEPADPLAWHPLPVDPPGTVRRVRRTDLDPPASPGAPTRRIDVLFRDSYTEPDGTQTVIHEYAVQAIVDLRAGCIVDVTADPRVLPATECPAAAASAGQLAGAPLAGLRARVRRDLRGNHTCTHLNDLLRTFADLPALGRLADRALDEPATAGGSGR